jgi:hypothetical protein
MQPHQRQPPQHSVPPPLFTNHAAHQAKPPQSQPPSPLPLCSPITQPPLTPTPHLSHQLLAMLRHLLLLLLTAQPLVKRGLQRGRHIKPSTMRRCGTGWGARQATASCWAGASQLPCVVQAQSSAVCCARLRSSS